MLSRTADHLFWMSRYVERAENTARMLDVNLQVSLLPQSRQSHDRAWRAVLEISELQPLFDERYPRCDAPSVLHFMVRDPDNPSSILNCLRTARENARAVRGSLTTEMWETQNATWLELQRLFDTRLPERDPAAFFEWVKFRSHLAHGVALGTMLQDEAWHFLHMGTHLERADNTARLLDVRFYQPDESGDEPADPEAIATGRDFYHWMAILRSLSGFEIYRKVYHDVITPERVAELLILRPDMPRSLSASLTQLTANLQHVGGDARSRETERQAGMLHAELRYGRIEDILQTGLHPFLTGFLARINGLGNRISQDFLVPLSV